MFLTNNLLVRSFKFGRPGGGVDKFWRVQQYLRLAWNFRGRKQNCYALSMRTVHRALMYATLNRKVKKESMRTLWNRRIHASAQEHDLHGNDLLEGLARCNIRLDRKVLNDLAIYEPRTFQSITEVARQKLGEEGLPKSPLIY